MKFTNLSLKHLLVRLLIFIVIFILISGIIGSWIVSTRLLNSFSFYIYGNMGKMVLLSAVMFVLLIKDKLDTIKFIKWSKNNVIYLFIGLIFIPTFFILASILLNYQSFGSNIFLSLLTHLILILIPFLFFLGIFGHKFLINSIKQFHKELKICLSLSIVLYFVIFQVWKLWPIFSSGVLTIVKFLLSLTFTNVEYIKPFTLVVNNFSVSILQACSGLDSLFMFSALYVFFGLINHKILNIKKIVYLYPLAATGMYLVNIFRVYILIVIGSTISPDFALRMFHTYAGMVLFILYFGLFWKFVYRKVLEN